MPVRVRPATSSKKGTRMNLPSHVKLVIFDVDGTLVTTKSGETFRKTADDWQWLPGRLETLKVLQAQGVHLGIATNQGGVAFGYLDPIQIGEEIQKVADAIGAEYVGVWCYHPDASIPQWRLKSDMRKPGPGMLQAAMQWYHVEPIHTLMIGDMKDDKQAAQNAGVAFMWGDEFFGC